MAAALLLLPLSASAQQRPLVTEDPETIGTGRILTEFGFDYGKDVSYPASGLEGNLLRLPLIGISIGVSSIAEVQIDGGFYNRLSITERNVAPLSDMLTATGDSTSDVEDWSMGMKVRLLSETARRPTFGFRFATKLPNASNESGLGLDTTDFFALGARRQDGAVDSIRRQLRPGDPRGPDARRSPERRVDLRIFDGAGAHAGSRDRR